MAENNAVYPVGLYYVGPSSGTNSSQPSQSNGSDDRSIVVPDQMLPEVKQEDEGDILKADHDFSRIENQKEDRNSESYWEKRKQFTLAFAAGLRKFIQVHPELLRYGPKKNQGSNNASATVTSVGHDNDELSDRVNANCSPTPIDLNPTINITPIDAVESYSTSRPRRPQRNAAIIAAIKQETGDDDENDVDYSPRGRGARSRMAPSTRSKRGRRLPSPRSTVVSTRKRSRASTQPDLDESADFCPTEDAAYDMPVSVTIKEEPPDEEDDDD